MEILLLLQVVWPIVFIWLIVAGIKWLRDWRRWEQDRLGERADGDVHLSDEERAALRGEPGYSITPDLRAKLAPQEEKEPKT